MQCFKILIWHQYSALNYKGYIKVYKKLGDVYWKAVSFIGLLEMCEGSICSQTDSNRPIGQMSERRC